jgi:hypothetical protein
VTHEQKLHLLQELLNDLHQSGYLSSETLMQIASDVMRLEYEQDDDLISFTDLDHETEEE